jgi:hypothetical protein
MANPGQSGPFYGSKGTDSRWRMLDPNPIPTRNIRIPCNYRGRMVGNPEGRAEANVEEACTGLYPWYRRHSIISPKPRL